jgi:hypothetical protein
MAIKNLKAVISVPNRGNVPLTLGLISGSNFIVRDTTGAQQLRIPRRFPMADVVAPAGYFRHNIEQNASSGSASTAVSDEIGGVAGANALTTLGFELPRTEKLILLARKGPAATTAATITIKGSLEYKQPDMVITLPAADAINTLYEIDITNFGLFIGRKAGVSNLEDGILIETNHADTALCLIVRVA